MPARTGTGNQDANFKIYYSKKLPKQKYFSHRRKTVRDRPTKEQEARVQVQTTLLPEKMRRDVVMDSDDEGEESIEIGMDDDRGEDRVQVQPEPETTPVIEVEEQPRTASKDKTRCLRKRKSDTIDYGNLAEGYEAPMQPTAKRRRNASAPKKARRQVVCDSESENDESEDPASSKTCGSKTETARKLKRQSTMTQLVDGRRPLPGTKDPEFRKVKRISRTSWGKGNSKGSGKEKDGNQRTLTQMVPGLMPMGIVSDEDMDEVLEDVENGQAYHEAFVRRLAEQGLYNPDAGIIAQRHDSADNGDEIAREEQENKLLVAPPEADADDEADTYHPTQHIQTPTQKRRTTPRRSANSKNTNASSASRPRAVGKTRFALLATPERRRIREIPSSQSPAESLLSTQTTPHSRLGRTPLKQRSANDSRVDETPSKRKRVAFQEPEKTKQASPRASRPSLRKFGSVVQDSEEEEEEENEEEGLSVNDGDVSDAGQQVGAETQALIQGMDRPMPGRNIGSETQAMLLEIDQVCANAEEDAAWLRRGVSEYHHEGQNNTNPPGLGKTSPELGEENENDVEADDEEAPAPREAPYEVSQPGIKQEPQSQHSINALRPPLPQSSPPAQPPPSAQKPRTEEDIAEDFEASSTTQTEFPLLHSTPPPAAEDLDDGDAPETLPSTPMVIKSETESSDSEAELEEVSKKTTGPPLRKPLFQQHPTSLPGNHDPPKEKDHDSAGESEEKDHEPIPSTPYQESTDLDGHPIQVPRSPTLYFHLDHPHPPTHHPPASSPSSFSTAANQQLHSESHRHHHHYQASPPPPSQATTLPDSTQYPLPLPPPQSAQPSSLQFHTPKHNHRNSNIEARKVTMMKVIQPSSSSLSPPPPPPLIIPSSFPSPSKFWGAWHTTEEEGESCTKGQEEEEEEGGGGGWDSVVDFSIPAPPPGGGEEEEE